MLNKTLPVQNMLELLIFAVLAFGSYRKLANLSFLNLSSKLLL